MIAWLFWPSLALLAWLVIARFFPALGCAVCELGRMPIRPEPRGWPADEEVAATPPTLCYERYDYHQKPFSWAVYRDPEPPTFRYVGPKHSFKPFSWAVDPDPEREPPAFLLRSPYPKDGC